MGGQLGHVLGRESSARLGLPPTLPFVAYGKRDDRTVGRSTPSGHPVLETLTPGKGLEQLVGVSAPVH